MSFGEVLKWNLISKNTELQYFKINIFIFPLQQLLPKL